MAVTMHEVIIDAPTALSSLIFDDRHFPLEIGDLNSAADANLTSTGIYEYLLLLITTAKVWKVLVTGLHITRDLTTVPQRTQLF